MVTPAPHPATGAKRRHARHIHSDSPSGLAQPKHIIHFVGETAGYFSSSLRITAAAKSSAAWFATCPSRFTDRGPQAINNYASCIVSRSRFSFLVSCVGLSRFSIYPCAPAFRMPAQAQKCFVSRSRQYCSETICSPVSRRH